MGEKKLMNMQYVVDELPVMEDELNVGEFWLFCTLYCEAMEHNILYKVLRTRIWYYLQLSNKY